MTQHTNRPMQAREKLDFQFGERYFISNVRAYRDQITDPKLLDEAEHKAVCFDVLGAR